MYASAYRDEDHERRSWDLDVENGCAIFDLDAPARGGGQEASAAKPLVNHPPYKVKLVGDYELNKFNP